MGIFTRTRDSLRVLGDLKIVLMSRCLHFLWISSERPLMYGSSRNLGLPSGNSYCHWWACQVSVQSFSSGS